MKILHTVESYLPARHGMSEFVRQISERLVALGHEVTVATGVNPSRKVPSIEGVEVREFAVQGKSAIGLSGDLRSYQQFLLESKADVIVIFAAQQWTADLMFPIISHVKAKKVFVPNGFSALGDPVYSRYFEMMRGMFDLFDANVFCSDDYRDIQFARESGAMNLAFIPVGAPADEFDRPRDTTFRKRYGIPEDSFLVVHAAGYLSRAKGQREALEIFSRSGIRNATMLYTSPGFADPLADALTPKVMLKGIYNLLRGRAMSGFKFPAKLKMARMVYAPANRRMNRRIVTTALSQEEKVQAFLNADLFLFPSWVECSPLVIYEAAASRTPFLVTDVGNSKEIVRWTGGGEILPGSRQNDQEGSMLAHVPSGARLLTELWRDPKRRQEMAESGHRAWRAHFTWETIAAQYEALYLSLLRGEEIRGRFLPPPDAPLSIL